MPSWIATLCIGKLQVPRSLRVELEWLACPVCADEQESHSNGCQASHAGSVRARVRGCAAASFELRLAKHLRAGRHALSMQSLRNLQLAPALNLPPPPLVGILNCCSPPLLLPAVALLPRLLRPWSLVQSPHVINAVMECIEAMRISLGPTRVLQHTLQVSPRSLLPCSDSDLAPHTSAAAPA